MSLHSRKKLRLVRIIREERATKLPEAEDYQIVIYLIGQCTYTSVCLYSYCVGRVTKLHVGGDDVNKFPYLLKLVWVVSSVQRCSVIQRCISGV